MSPTLWTKDGSEKPEIVADHHRRAVAEIAHGLHVEDGIRGIADEQDDVGIGLLQLQDLRGDIGRIGVVRDLQADPEAGRARRLPHQLGDRGAIVGILVDDRDRLDRIGALGLDVLEKIHVGLGDAGRDRRGAEEILEAALGEVGGDQFAGQERDAVALGDRTRGLGHRRLIGAGQRHHLLLGDQAQRLVLAGRRAALVVGEHDLDLGVAEVGQAGAGGKRQLAEFRMRLVDDLGRELDPGLARGAGARGVAGQGIDGADLDALLRVGARGRSRQDGCQREGQNEGGFHLTLPKILATRTAGFRQPGLVSGRRCRSPAEAALVRSRYRDCSDRQGKARDLSVARGMSGFGSSRSVRFRRIGEVACWRRFGWLGSLRRSVGGGAGH